MPEQTLRYLTPPSPAADQADQDLDLADLVARLEERRLPGHRLPGIDGVEVVEPVGELSAQPGDVLEALLAVGPAERQRAESRRPGGREQRPADVRRQVEGEQLRHQEASPSQPIGIWNPAAFL
jgi:hypothetical protein